MLGFLFDSKLQEELNRQGRNYWDIYIEEILRLLGTRAEKIPPATISAGNKLAKLGVLIVGRQTSEQLDGAGRAAIGEWVRDGGTLIGFGISNMDEVFGVSRKHLLAQEPDEYTVSGKFDLRPHAITHEIHPSQFSEQRLLIVSDIQQVVLGGAFELARLYDTNGNDLIFPVITWNRFGSGFAGYFAFDVAQTVWLLHQGRPIPLDVEQTRNYPRVYDLLSIIGDNSRKIPYADEICFLVQNMIAQKNIPFVHQVPPKEGKVADALLYWGGDEYVGPTELSLNSSDWLASKGIGYHINIQAENHPMTEEEFKHIVVDNGHEISEFYHKQHEPSCRRVADEAMYVRQSNEFYERFGYRPIATVNGVCNWNGWADSARWMESAGSKADNSFSGINISLGHPRANGSFFGFGSGTTFPFYFYDDAEHNNRQIDLMEQPIVCYEIGHRGSLLDHETEASDEVHLPVEMAIKYHMVMNMFYHPIYIARYPLCRKAIEEILATIERKGVRVINLGNDAVHHWWKTRADATVEIVSSECDSVKFECNCNYADGMVVKMLTHFNVRTVYMDGRLPVEYEIRNEFAGHWLYVVVGKGKHMIEVCFEESRFQNPAESSRLRIMRDYG